MQPARKTGKASSSSIVADKKKKEKKLTVSAPPGTRKLTKQQAAELLKVFWVELLQNNVRQVRKLLAANLHSLDFCSARYAPAADGSALHLCAQHGLLAMATLLVDLGAVDVNAQNKVGSTALHVACKFGQEQMILYLLGLNVRMDIPDNQHRIAFDVAPFAVVDRCVLAPLREQERVAQEDNDGLRGLEASALADAEDAERERCNADMALADAESWAMAEREELHATRAIDNEWSGRVQAERDELERCRVVYREYLDVLEDAKERVESARGRAVAEVERDKMEAQRAADQAQLRVSSVQEALEMEQRDLDDQLGLLDAANALPSDPAVQEWVLSVIQAMIEQDERGWTAESGLTRSARLLARVEVVTVVTNVLTRFSTLIRLQLCALRCLAAVIRHVVSVVETSSSSVDEKRSLRSFLGQVAVLKTEKSSLLVLCRDALVRNSTDVEASALVAAIHYHLLRVRAPSPDYSSRSLLLSMRFSHERRNQTLPLDMLKLYAQARRLGSVVWADTAWVQAVRDAAFLLFTVAKSSAIKALVASDAVPVALSWVYELAAVTPADTATSKEEAMLAAMQYLLGALSFLHSVPWFPTASATVMLASTMENTQSRLPPVLEQVYPWCASDVRTLLNAVSPCLQSLGEERSSLDSDATGRYRMLVRLWTLKLLRNLVLHPGEAARAVRVELFEPPVFVMLSETVLSLLRFAFTPGVESSNGNDGSGSNSRLDTQAPDVPDRCVVVGVWLDLAEEVWVRHCDTDGALRSTAEFVMEHALALLSRQSQHLGGSCRPDVSLAVCCRILGTVALALSNDMNARWVGARAEVLDDAVAAFLRWLLTLYDWETGARTAEEVDVSSASVFEALAHVLRVYLASLNAQLADDDGGDAVAKTQQRLHGRCRAVGLCAVVRAFRKVNHGPGDGLDERQEDAGASVAHVASLKRMRAASKATGRQLQLRPPQLTGQDQRRVLRALSRAVAQLAGCRC